MNQNEFSEVTQKLELFISCRQLNDLDIVSVCNPYVIIYQKNNNYWIKIGQTEMIQNNLNPNFATSIQIEYHVEVQQYLKLEVHHYISPTQSKIIGIAEITVAQIAGSKNQIFIGDLVTISGRNNGNFIIYADIVKLIKDELILTLSGHSLPNTRFWFWHGTCPFLRFYRLIMDDNKPVLVYETEFAKDTTQPTWKDINFKALKLCNGDYLMPIKVELWDHRNNGKHLYLGETTFCINELIEYSTQNKILKKELKNKTIKKESSGILQFNRFQFDPCYTILDYRSGGQQIKLNIAIDCTASNNKLNDPNSLHYMTKNGAPNQYLQAITSLVEILINYDNNKKVPIYGFGCKPKMNLINTNQTLHLFPLNDNQEDPEVYGLDGIVECYRKSLPKLLFDGPAILTPNLKNAMDLANQWKNQGNENYQILIILTVGQIRDIEAFIDDVIASSHLPLSIIIIGIGDANFDDISILDNQQNSMVDSKGNQAVRNLFQFVHFNKLKNDPTLLAKQVLPKLSNQLLEYMKLMNIPLKPSNSKTLWQQYLKQPIQNPLPQQYVSQQSQFPPQLLYPPQLQYPPYQPHIPQQNFQYQQQQDPQTDVVTNKFGQGLTQQGFLKELVQQKNQQVNYPSQ